MTEEELLLPAPESSLSPSPSPALEDEAAHDSLHTSHSTAASIGDDSEGRRLTDAGDETNAVREEKSAETVRSEDSLVAPTLPPSLLPASHPVAASERTAQSEAPPSNDINTTSGALTSQPTEEEQQAPSMSNITDVLVESAVASAAAPHTDPDPVVDMTQQQPSTAQSDPSPVLTSLAGDASAASVTTAPSPVTAPTTLRSASNAALSPGQVHPRSPSSEEWHSILLSKQQSQLSVKAIQTLPSPPSTDRKRRRGKQRDETKPLIEPVADDEEDEERSSVAARLRGRRAKREVQEEKTRDEKADEMSVDEDEPVVQSQPPLSSRAELRALLDSDDLSAPSLQSSSLLLSSLDSFSSSFHSTLTQLTSSLNSQIEQHTRSLQSEWQTQLSRSHSTHQQHVTQAVDIETTRWQTMAQQWAAECRRVRSELDGLRDVQSQLHSLLTSHPALAGDERADSDDKMELFIQYYREKERGMRDKDKKLNTREKELREREEKVEVRVMFVTQEKKREVDEMREKVVRMRNEWEVERSKGLRERKELKERVEEMKLDRMMRESEVSKLKGRVRELTDTIAVMETRLKGAVVGGGGGGGGVVKEERQRVEVNVVEKERERERREKQDKYVADVEEYLRRQTAELKELRAAEATVREEVRRKEEEAGLEKRRAEIEERRRVEAEARWNEAEKQRVELGRQVAALQAERDSMAEKMRVAQSSRQPPPPQPPLLPSPPQQHTAPLSHLVHPSRAATVSTYTAPPPPPPTTVGVSSSGSGSGGGGGLFDVDSFALVREMTQRLEQDKRARDRQAAVDQQQRDERERHERDRLARIEAEQRATLERVEAIEREKREREQREQIEREELQRLTTGGSGGGGGGMANGGWKSVKVTALTDRTQPPLLPTPAAAAVGAVIAGLGHTGRVCSFFNTARGCRKGEHCDHLHVLGKGSAATGGVGGVGMAAGMFMKMDEKEDGELDELPLLVQ